MTGTFSRRAFLGAATAVGGSLALPNFVIRAAEAAAPNKLAIPAYTGWKDVYRSQ